MPPSWKDYYAELALSPGAAKETRVFGLGDWIVDRFRGHWFEGMEPLWTARRSGTQAAAPWVVAIVFLSVLATLVFAGRAATNGDLSLTALAIVGQSVLGMAGILFSFPREERWLDEGSVAVPAVEEFEREAQSFRLSSGGRDPGRSACADIRFANVSFGYPGTNSKVLSDLDLRIPFGRSLAIALATWLAIEGRATAGDVLMTLSLAGQVHGYVAGGAGLFSWILGTLKAVERLLWLTDYVSDATSADAGRTPSPRRLTAGIELEDVSFSYPGTDNEVLSDVSLHLPAGGTVAVVGENGAGKTTLVKLLCQFYDPSKGRILVDGTGLDQHDVEDWRAGITAAFQDFARFQFLARETVGVGDLKAVEDLPAVERAVVRAGAEDVSAGLPSGLETQLGREWKSGVELSEGQWQKLALARALMRERPVLLILDEPTASLDAETEYALFARYAAAVRETASEVGTITILVSHRFSTVRMADSIVVLDGGRVIEVGSHDELMARRGLYAELYTLQERAYR